MKKSSGMWMAALTLTAIVMGVVLLASPSRQASADMLNAQSGFSIMTTTPAGGGNELLVIVDKSSQAMVIYQLNGNDLRLMSGANFGRLFTPAR